MYKLKIVIGYRKIQISKTEYEVCFVKKFYIPPGYVYIMNNNDKTFRIIVDTNDGQVVIDEADGLIQSYRESFNSRRPGDHGKKDYLKARGPEIAQAVIAIFGAGARIIGS